MSERRSTIESALDLFVYAPVGLAVEAQRLLPELAREGRTRVEQRVTLARFVGRLAVRTGRERLEQRFAASAPSTESAVESSTDTVAPTPSSAATSAPTIEPSTEPAPGSAPDPSISPDAADLAIPGYDSLSASQVVSRLGALSLEELTAVADYESSHRRRRTVLGKIDQLRARAA
jgi:hypothetical protein